MREKSWVIVIAIVFIVLALVGTVLGSIFYLKFNFYKSEISINGKYIEEKLYFGPDKPYHTLYRDFTNPIFLTEGLGNNYILINSVSCEIGEPYAYASDGTFRSFDSQVYNPLPFTEQNEYGCTFGNTFGFNKGAEYWIKSSYELHPENLFEINGKYYIKFVVYSPNKHQLLIKDNNFVVLGEAITKDFFFPSENVIVYIPYQGQDTSSFNIINKDSFEFDDYSLYLFLFLLSIIPGLSFFLVWRFFGREKMYKDLPETLSMYPEGRKAWEVNVFFNAPFGSSDKNLFPTFLLDLYRRKIIDLKEKEKKNEIWIKIKEHKKEKLDEMEKQFISFLKKIRDLGKEKYIDEQGYFNLKKSAGSVGLFKKHELTKASRKFSSELGKKKKKYIDDTGNYLFIIWAGILLFMSIMITARIMSPIFLIPFFIMIIVSVYVVAVTTLLLRFKGDYYGEYQEWQAFKRYLKEFPSMRDSPPKAVVLWEHYLVYATALGVGKQVAKKLKEWKIIDVHRYNVVVYTYSSSYSASSSAGASGGAGGFGGAGAGGVGGGGGGGR